MTGPGSFRQFGGAGPGAASSSDPNWTLKDRASYNIYNQAFFTPTSQAQIGARLSKSFALMTSTAKAVVSGTAGTFTRIYLDPNDQQSGTVQIPASVSEFTVEGIGPAGYRNDGTATSNKWGGSAGGSYAKRTRVPNSGATIYNFTVGLPGSGIPATFSKQDGTVLMQADKGGDAIGLTGGQPGTNNVGDVIYLGGAGGNTQSGCTAGGGGGGAAGPNGPGGKGGVSHSSGAKGGGGGGANGGGDGTNGSNSSTTSGLGGTARDGTPGGSTNTTQTTPANGSGGGGSAVSGYNANTLGSIDYVWDTSHGVAGGTGGNVYGYAPIQAGSGYGGGVGGNADFITEAGRGLIVITYYAPAAAIVGRLNAGLGLMSSLASAKVQVQATLGKSFGAMTSAAGARVQVTGRSTQYFGPMGLVSAAKLQIRAALNAAFSAMTGSAHGGTTIGGRTTASFSAMTSTASGKLQLRASLAGAFSKMLGSAAARVPVAARIAASFATMGAVARGKLAIKGKSATAFRPMSGSSTGLLWIRAHATASFLPMAGFAKARRGDPPYPPASRTVVVRHPSRIVVAYHPPRVVKA